MAYRATLLALMAPWTLQAFASMAPPLIQVYERSELVAKAQAISWRTNSALFSVSTVYRNALVGDTNVPCRVIVTPVLVPGERPLTTAPQLQVDGVKETVILFLKRSAQRDVFAPISFGKLSLTRFPSKEPQHPFERLLTIWGSSDEAAKVEAMASEFRQGDSILRHHARSYLSHTIAGAKKANQYTDQVLSFLNSSDKDFYSLGLTLTQEQAVDGALPRLIELTTNSDIHIVGRASMALRHYSQPTVLATYLRLMRHSEPHVRIRAIIDSDEIVSPEIVSGLEVLASDPDPAVRAMVLRGFSYRSSNVKREHLVPIVVKLRNDASESVREAVSRYISNDHDLEKMLPE